MRFVSFGDSGQEKPGVLVDEQWVVPLLEPLHRWGYPVTDVNDILPLLPELQPRIGELITSRENSVALHATRLGPPVPRSGTIFAVGANNRSHLAELDVVDFPSAPVLFSKTASSLAGPYDDVQIPAESKELDYEIELAVVIGHAGRRIPTADALHHVAGYMIANDVTARDVILGESHKNPLYMQVLRGKGYDTFCPTGPWLVTPDEAGAVPDLRLRLWVNDDLRQDDTCAQMIFDVPHIIASVSEFVTVQPGDIILTGSPPGVGMSRKPPEYLSPDDTLRLAITGLGEMRTLITNEPQPPTP